MKKETENIINALNSSKCVKIKDPCGNDLLYAFLTNTAVCVYLGCAKTYHKIIHEPLANGTLKATAECIATLGKYEITDIPEFKTDCDNCVNNVLCQFYRGYYYGYMICRRNSRG